MRLSILVPAVLLLLNGCMRQGELPADPVVITNTVSFILTNSATNTVTNQSVLITTNVLTNILTNTVTNLQTNDFTNVTTNIQIFTLTNYSTNQISNSVTNQSVSTVTNSLIQTNVVIVPESTNTLVLTNTVISNLIRTNQASVTNHILLTNSNFLIAGDLVITNVANEGAVQPTFRVSGALDPSLSALLTYIRLTVTNTGYTTNAQIDGNSWSAVIRKQPQTYISVLVEAVFGNFGGWSALLNLHVTNLPSVENAWAPDGLVTNSAWFLLSGKSSVTTNSLLSGVTAFVLDETGNTNVLPCGIAGVPGWDQTVSSANWSKLVPLSFGENRIWASALSSDGLTTTGSAFRITRSLIAVDGNEDTIWASASLPAASTQAGYSGYQLGELRVTNDAQNLYFWVDAGNVPDLGNAGARLSIAIRTNTSSGVTNDAWGGRFSFDPASGLPQFQLQYRISGTTGVNGFAFYRENAGAWTDVLHSWNNGALLGTKFAVDRTKGFEVSLPNSLLSITAGSTLSFIAVLSGADGSAGNLQVWDALPESFLPQVITNSVTNIVDTNTNVTQTVVTNNTGNPVAASENDFGQVLRTWSAPYVLR